MYNLTEVKKHIHVCIFTQCLNGLDYNVHTAFVYVCCLSCVGWLGGFSLPFNSSILYTHLSVLLLNPPLTTEEKPAAVTPVIGRACPDS